MLILQVLGRVNAVDGGADLLGQDKDLHYEDTAEYEAGASHVVLEGWQCCGSVLLRENKGGEKWRNGCKTMTMCNISAVKHAQGRPTLKIY